MVRLHISNMTCGGCIKGVTRAVQGVTASVPLDFDLSKREVAIGSVHDRDAIIAALKRAGFEATFLGAAQE